MLKIRMQVFKKIQKAVYDGKILIEILPGVADEDWNWMKQFELTSISAILLLIKSWLFWIVGIFLLLISNWAFALLSFIVGIVFARYEKWRRIEEFKKDIISDLKLLVLLYSHGKIAFQVREFPHKAIVFPAKPQEILNAISK